MRHFLTLCLLVLLAACNQGDAGNSPATDSGKTTSPALVTDTANLPKSPESFEKAKRVLYNEVYKDHNITFYCGCDYDPKSKIVDWKSCGYVPRKNAERASRIEAEHVMPAHQFGKFLQCWREPQKVCAGKNMSGRECCQAEDPLFEAAHNDLHNLFPAVGEVNGDRSNFNWGMVEGNKREYGACPMEIDESIRRAEPPDNVKGNVARVMFYMEDTYGFKLSDQDRQLFNAWSKMDPPDAWEIERNQRIAAIEGKDNRFISQYAAGASGAGKKTSTTAPATAVVPVNAKTEAKTDLPATKASAEGFSCEIKKTCKQMSSCAEAKFQLKTCGNSAIDGDGDGKPCASICK